MTIDIPWPPSVNTYWRHVGPRVLISAEGREYRGRVMAAWIAAGRPVIAGRLAVSIDAMPPNRQRRDLDNLLKAPLDALQAAGMYADDSLIDELAIRRGEIIAGGRLCVTIRERSVEI